MDKMEKTGISFSWGYIMIVSWFLEKDLHVYSYFEYFVFLKRTVWFGEDRLRQSVILLPFICYLGDGEGKLMLNPSYIVKKRN